MTRFQSHGRVMQYKCFSLMVEIGHRDFHVVAAKTEVFT